MVLGLLRHSAAALHILCVQYVCIGCQHAIDADVTDVVKSINNVSLHLPLLLQVFVKELMTSTVDRYVMYLRRKSNGTFTFVSELNAANRVLNDKLVIQEFFETHMIVEEERTLDASGEGEDEEGAVQYVKSNAREVREMRLFIEGYFETVINLACVIPARHPSAVEQDVRALYKKWGVDGEYQGVSALVGSISCVCVKMRVFR